MNLKLNNEVRNPTQVPPKVHVSSVKEERRRTGRYIAILVGISLLLLAIYHAWVRRIPVVASLVVPALIMFIYVGWVLYSASRDKHRLLDVEANLNAASLVAPENDTPSTEVSPKNAEISVTSSKESTKLNGPDVSIQKNWADISTVLLKGEGNFKTEEENNRLIKPIILVNDKPPDDWDQKYTHVSDDTSNNERFKCIQTKRKFKRKFCRSRKHAVFKRSYSIA